MSLEGIYLSGNLDWISSGLITWISTTIICVCSSYRIVLVGITACLSGNSKIYSFLSWWKPRSYILLGKYLDNIENIFVNKNEFFWRK